MATQLAVYQEALEHLGERPLASLSEDREPRRALDAAWDTTLTYCLEQGFWNWAMRSVEIEPEPAIEPAFGYQAAFSKPTDWLRTYVVSANDTFDPPLPDFIDENGYWMAHLQSALTEGTDPASILAVEQMVGAMSAADVQAAARRYLDARNVVQVVLYPEAAKAN